jgi:hypothetical protein
VRELLDLYCLGQEYEVRDLMWRCEEEINLKVTPENVLCILVNYYTRLNSHKA